MIETSEAIGKLSAAIIHVQGSVSSVHKDKVNPHFKNRYATLENVIDTARPALQEAEIAFVQAPGLVIDGSVEVTTMLVHSSGEWMRSTLHVPLQKRDAQGVGSAITYGCRYSLMAMLGLPPSDDDGEAASVPPKKAATNRYEPNRNDSEPGESPPPSPDETYAPPPRRKSGLPETGWREDGSRTSYSLKQSGSWEKLMLKISVALGDCKTRVTLDQLRSDIWKDAHAENWNGSYFNALKAEFDQHYARVDAEQERQFDAETEAAALDQRAREELNYLAGHPLNGG